MADERTSSAEGPPLTRDDVARLVRQHLESLQAAGVEWAPAGREALAAAAVLFTPPAEETRGTTATDPAAARRHKLQVLAENVAGCTRCAALAATRTQTVFGVGRLDPELCLIGEAPGADEDARGEPFVGAAGQLLNRILAAMGLKREEVYICNIIKCRPPRNRTPAPDEAANCRDHLERQLELVRPRFICALGATAAQYLLGTSKSVGALRGKFHDYHGIPVLCTYHPAYMLPHRSPDPRTERERKKQVWEDMKLLLARMGRPVEKK